MSLQPFEVAVPQATLDDLASRLASARLDPEGQGADTWDAGMNPHYLRELIAYWRLNFNWREQEALINRHPQFRATIGDAAVHFIHQRGQGPAPLPLLLTHGFPDSFLRFLKVIPLLTNPAAHGGDARDAFDVVVPSLPGYAFSDPPNSKKAGGIFHVGDLWHKLMTDELGYQRFGAHGGDWGSTVTEHLARSHPSCVVGIHLTDVPFWHAFQRPADPSPAEDAFLDANQQFPMRQGAYAMIQGSRPQTLADSLNDSPVGLAAWLVEKFQRWSDCGDRVERRFTKDELLTNVTTYWVTETIGSSFLPYYDLLHASVLRWIVERAKEWTHGAKVPAGFALFPKDLSNPPEEWARRFYDVQRWTVMPRGGHFAAMEEPELLVDEIRAFFRPLRTAGAH
ncbi:MAG TPA: epoxide hydrolase [Polyangia bacterium]|jgi:pimeloyl-ACP methyl ester carboxylesterase|nr:epoxide hydrolase [Polyangia bacterium]